LPSTCTKVAALGVLHAYEPSAADLEIGTAGLLALGFFFGACSAPSVATRIHGDVLRRIFGAFLLLVFLHMIFGRHGR
jgi:uncharacterized membrane protein YfcA